MLTPKMGGIFDCREYDGKAKDHAARRLKADGENITVSALFLKEELPEQFRANGQPDEFVKERATRKERKAAEAEGREPVNDAYSVAFKIGAGTRWFDRYGKPCDRPTNEELESKRWQVQIDFTRREKDAANPLKPTGYWVNSIMIAEVTVNPFEGQAFEEAPEIDPEPEQNKVVNLPFN